MARSLDLDQLMTQARRWLGREPLTGIELAQRLGISQSSASRLIQHHRAQILTTGQARRTRHVLRRLVADVETPVPIYEIDEQGSVRRIAWLHPVAATGYHVETCCSDVDSATYDDWPWFLHQLRPAGFLGRHVARQYPMLGYGEEPRLWSGDQLLRYLSRYGCSASGALIIGDSALEQWLRIADAPPPADIPAEEQYPRLVNDVLAGAPPGSSAEGEQPKFLVARTASRPERLVKFSPPCSDAVGRRIADLLIAEHHALGTLSSAGIDAAASSIVEAGGRIFLEAERFDRTPTGRIGLLSLEAFDLQFVGDAGRNRWPPIVQRLIRDARLPESVLGTVQRLHAFGHFIGNNDMHPGNLSFVVRGHRVSRVSPAYDMAPMSLSPVRGELSQCELTIAPSAALSRTAWEWAATAAENCWRRIAVDPRVSPGFRVFAETCVGRVASARDIVRRFAD